MTFEPGPELTRRFNLCAKKPEIRSLTRDLTGLNVFLTLMFAWLHRVSRQEALSVGTMSHNRSKAEFRNTAGLFTELFPVVSRVRSTDSFVDLIRRVQAASLSTLTNARSAASSLIGREPYNVVVNYITSSFGQFADLPVTSTWVHAGHGDPEHLLRLQVHDMDASGSAVLHFDFNVELFDERQRKWAVAQFVNLLDAFLQDPEQRIDSVPLAGADERVFLGQLELTHSTLSVNETVVDLFRSCVLRTPDAIAAQLADSSLTFAELDRQSTALAIRLADQFARPETSTKQFRVEQPVIAICMPRSIEMVVSVLGVLKAGGCYLLMATRTPDQRRQQMLADSGCLLTLTHEETHAGFESLGIPAMCVTEELCRARPGTLNEPELSPSHIAYTIYTSGSTGEPRGVVIDHRALAHYVCWAADVYTKGEQLSFPLFSTFGFDLTVTSIFVPLCTGGRIEIYPDVSHSGQPDLSVVDVFNDDKVDIVKLTPSHLSLVKDFDLTTSRIRCLVVGGENFPTDLARTVSAAFGNEVAIFNEYGPTEATVGCMLHRYDPQSDTDSAVPIGRPADHATIRILEESGENTPIGIPGEIYIGGKSLAQKYLNQPEQTASSFVMDPVSGERLYRSGDLGRWRADGVLEYLGRLDRQVKLSGIRIELGEVESAISSHPKVESCFVALRNVSAADCSEESIRYCTDCGLPSNYPEVVSISRANAAIARLLNSGGRKQNNTLRRWMI